MSQHYSTIYNKVYEQYINRDKDVNKYVQTRVKRCRSNREKLWLTKHLLKMAKTQTIGRKFTQTTLDKIEHESTLVRIRSTIGVRKIQKRAIRFLYRPHGSIYEKNKRRLECDFSCLL